MSNRQGSKIKLMKKMSEDDPPRTLEKSEKHKPTKKPTRAPQTPQTSIPASGELIKIARLATNSTSPKAAATAAPKLIYYGGPVIANVKVITIWWGGVSKVQYASQLEKFYAGVTKSNWFRIFSEQSTTSTKIGMGSWVKSFSDSTAPTGTVTDTQIQSRLKALISNGSVPAPDANTYYAIHFAPGITIKDGTDISCQQFCAYHGTIAYSVSVPYIYYGIMPDQGGSCASGCGSNSNRFNNLCSVSSHELGEMVTDPAVGLATSLASPLAWYDPNNGENGDICNAQQGTTVGSDGVAYTVQAMWSNKANACLINAPLAPVSPPVSPPVSSTCYNLNIRLRTDSFPSETYMIVTSNNVEKLNTKTQALSANTLYGTTLCLSPSSCNKFTIYDTYGDGICCSSGSGYYNLTWNGTA